MPTTFKKILWSVDGYLDCFHLLSIVNNATMHLGVQVSAESLLSILLGIYLGVELLITSNKNFYLSSYIYDVLVDVKAQKYMR